MITFKPLSREIVLQVVDKFVDELSIKLALKKVDLEVSDALKNWLAEKGYHVAYGARPLARTIQDHLKKPLADELLFGKLSKNGGKVTADLKDGKPSFTFS